MLRKLALDNFVLIVQYAVGGFVSLFLVPHIVREVGLAAFGSLAIALSWASYGSVIVQYAFQYSGPHRMAHLSDAPGRGGLFIRILNAKVILVAAVLPAMLLVAGIGEDQSPDQVRAARVLVLLLLPVATALHSGWYLQAAGRFTTLCMLSVCGASATLAMGYGLVRTGSPWAVVAAAASFIVGPFIVGAGSLLISLQALRPLQRLRSNWESILDELKDGWPLFISQFAAVAYGASGPIIVGALAGTMEAGAYGAIERVCNAIMGACMLTHVAAYPKLARLFKADRRLYLKLLALVIGGYFVAAVSSSILILSFSRYALAFLFGGQGTQNHEFLLWSAIAWLILGGFGAPLTGYLTVSGRSGEVFPLTRKILMASLLIGIPGVALFGGGGWMSSLAASQLLVIYRGVRAWMLEVEELKS